MADNDSLSNLNSENTEGSANVIASATTIEFSGPIPHPAILAQYESIQPGLADRIIKMAESQSEHRKSLESTVIRHDRIKSILGLIFAFVIVIMAIGAGVYLVISGQQLAGAFFTSFPLLAIVSAFIYQQRGKEK